MSTLQTTNLKHPDSGTNNIQFDSSGNVGINDAAPSEKLNVGGNIMLEGDNQYLYLTNQGVGSAGIYVRGIQATDNGTLRNHTTGVFTWEVTGSEKARMNSSGNFGLGADPVAKLDVNGTQVSNVVAMAGLDVDCSLGNYFTKTINGNSTFTFSNVPASRAFSFVLELTHTSGTVTWPSSVKFPADTAPTLTTGKTHLFVFISDSGSTRFRAATVVDYVN